MALDLTIPSYAIVAIVAYYALLFAMSRVRLVRGSATGVAPATRLPILVVLIPARNEDRVLAEALRTCALISPSERCRILVVNDGSTDATGEIVDAFVATNSRIRVLHRTPEEAGHGKSDVLNAAFAELSRWCEVADPWLSGEAAGNVVVGILDADGMLEADCLEKVAGYFVDARVASVQVGVRIGNACRSELARMQDMEFVGFSWLVQVARDPLGSSGLGGNGQFTRLSALQSLGAGPWTDGALTEDLDLGLRLVIQGWRTRFCATTQVTQQGLESWRPLLRQRTRWIQGHYQCWRYLGPLASSRKARLATRIDLVTYLLLVVTVLLVSATTAASVLGYLGVIDVTNSFLGFLGDGLERRTVSLLISVIPVVIFLWTYQRHSAYPVRRFELPAYGLAFTMYTYVWLVTTLWALLRLTTRRTSWVKTPRVNVTAPV